MPSCNATYKLAIKFANWRADGAHFYHPFQRYETVDGYNMAEWWLKLKQDDEPFDYACFTIPAMCDAKLSPRYFDGRVFDDKVQDYFAGGRQPKNSFLSDHKVQYPYAYHFDASLLAEFLKGYAMQRGVEQVIDEVNEVKLRGGRRHRSRRHPGAWRDLRRALRRLHRLPRPADQQGARASRSSPSPTRSSATARSPCRSPATSRPTASSPTRRRPP